jgi:hypothetical protein
MTLFSPTSPATLVVPLVPAGPAAAVWPSANRAVFQRVRIPTASTYRYINWVVGVQSGNVQVGLVSLSGTDRATYTREMNSGVIACPAAGNIRTDLGATPLAGGDYALFMWADNATFQTRYGTASAWTGLRVGGIASSLGTGVGTSGTLQWDNPQITISLEGDV